VNQLFKAKAVQSGPGSKATAVAMGSCHGRAAAKWWEETTAPHVLSSPWVRFPFGKVLRGAFMVATFMVWLDATFLRSGTVSYLDPYTTDSNIQPLALILVWYFWVASLWFFFQSNWESLSGSLLFALGVTISIWTMCLQEYWVATSLGTNYVLVLLLNCSVHPVTILPNNIFGVLWAIYMSTKTDHMFFDPVHLPLEVYSLSSAWICFVAFTRNFTLRVETYFALMEATEPTEQQRATSDRSDIADPFRRSLGAYCLVLVAGVNNWFFWAWVLWIKKQRDQDGSFHYWKNHLPTCTMAAPFLGLACISLVPFLRKSCAVDVAMALFGCLPAIMLLLDWIVALRMADPRDNPMFYSFARSLFGFGLSQQLYSPQMLLHSGTHPFICLPVTLIFVGINLIPSAVGTGPVIDHHFCIVLSCLQMVSYATDYFTRKAALAAAPREHEEHSTAVNSMQLAQL